MLAPGLSLVHSQRAEDLRQLLCAWCERRPLPPLATETILVQSNGIAEWLKLGFAEQGIAAGLEFLLPAQFLWRAYRAVLGTDAVPETSPFDKERLRWRIFRLLDELSAPEYAPLQRYLARDADGRRRFQLAQRIADLFDQYQVYRADWLSAWEAGRNLLPGLDGQARPVPAEQLWQPRLWRALRADLEKTATPGVSRGEIHQQFLARLPSAELGGLPQRLLVFGISSLPQQTLQALAALARRMPVLFLVLDPSLYYWGDIVSGYDLLRRAARGRKPGRHSASEAPSVAEHGHPLLAAWGKTGRDYLAALEISASELGGEERVELFSPGPQQTLLQQLQDDILQLRPTSESRALWPPVRVDGDDSLRFHVAHGPLRELEVLQDQILEALRRDASLHPRDILIMVPEMETFAPRIAAIFGRYSAPDPRALPYRIVDTAGQSETAFLRILAQLLALPQSRLPASMLWDLLDLPALRRRFRIAEEDLPLLRSTLQSAGARWGLDADQRRDLGVGEETAHTWLFALQRLFLGYALGGEADCWGIEAAYLPLEEGERLAPFLELLQSLATWQQRLQRPLPPAQWRHQLENLLNSFFLPVDASDEAALVAAREALQEWMEECEAAQLTTPLSIEIVAPAWQDKMQGALAQAGGFFSGGLTFATLMPMRAIPFRHIYLLGMNEKDYPRRQLQPEFDLLRGDYRPGDRSRREDDRYLFLEALLSARERLHIYWSGRNPRTDAEEPPSVLVAQLRDHLARVWCAESSAGTLRGPAFLHALTQQHPLQPFSARYLAGEARSYAREWWQPSNPFPAASAITAEPLHSWRLSDLQALGKNPARYFLQQGLGLYPALAGEDLAEDLEPFALDGLQQWQLRQELIEAAQRSPEDVERARQQIEDYSRRQRRRGDLPAAAFGDLLAEQLQQDLQAPLARYAALCSRFTEALPSHGLRLSIAACAVEGEISGLRQDTSGSLILPRWSASHLKKDSNQRLDKIWPYWIEHLALHADGVVLHSHLLDQTNHFCLAPLTQDQAERQLQQIISAAGRGRLQPLPFLLSLPGKVFDTGGRVDADRLRAAYPALAQHDWYLRRVWPDADALLAVGLDAIDECYQTLALPLVECLTQWKEALG